MSFFKHLGQLSGRYYFHIYIHELTVPAQYQSGLLQSQADNSQNNQLHSSDSLYVQCCKKAKTVNKGDLHRTRIALYDSNTQKVNWGESIEFNSTLYQQKSQSQISTATAATNNNTELGEKLFLFTVKVENAGSSKSRSNSNTLSYSNTVDIAEFAVNNDTITETTKILPMMPNHNNNDNNPYHWPQLRLTIRSKRVQSDEELKQIAQFIQTTVKAKTQQQQQQQQQNLIPDESISTNNNNNKITSFSDTDIDNKEPVINTPIKLNIQTVKPSTTTAVGTDSIAVSSDNNNNNNTSAGSNNLSIPGQSKSIAVSTTSTPRDSISLPAGFESFSARKRRSETHIFNSIMIDAVIGSQTPISPESKSTSPSNPAAIAAGAGAGNNPTTLPELNLGPSVAHRTANKQVQDQLFRVIQSKQNNNNNINNTAESIETINTESTDNEYTDTISEHELTVEDILSSSTRTIGLFDSDGTSTDSTAIDSNNKSARRHGRTPSIFASSKAKPKSGNSTATTASNTITEPTSPALLAAVAAFSSPLKRAQSKPNQLNINITPNTSNNSSAAAQVLSPGLTPNKSAASGGLFKKLADKVRNNQKSPIQSPIAPNKTINASPLVNTAATPVSVSTSAAAVESPINISALNRQRSVPNRRGSDVSDDLEARKSAKKLGSSDNSRSVSRRNSTAVDGSRSSSSRSSPFASLDRATIASLNSSIGIDNYNSFLDPPTINININSINPNPGSLARSIHNRTRASNAESLTVPSSTNKPNPVKLEFDDSGIFAIPGPINKRQQSQQQQPSQTNLLTSAKPISVITNQPNRIGLAPIEIPSATATISNSTPSPSIVIQSPAESINTRPISLGLDQQLHSNLSLDAATMFERDYRRKLKPAVDLLINTVVRSNSSINTTAASNSIFDRLKSKPKSSTNSTSNSGSANGGAGTAASADIDISSISPSVSMDTPDDYTNKIEDIKYWNNNIPTAPIIILRSIIQWAAFCSFQYPNINSTNTPPLLSIAPNNSANNLRLPASIPKGFNSFIPSITVLNHNITVQSNPHNIAHRNSMIDLGHRNSISAANTTVSQPPTHIRSTTALFTSNNSSLNSNSSSIISASISSFNNPPNRSWILSEFLSSFHNELFDNRNNPNQLIELLNNWLVLLKLLKRLDRHCRDNNQLILSKIIKAANSNPFKLLIQSNISSKNQSINNSKSKSVSIQNNPLDEPEPEPESDIDPQLNSINNNPFDLNSNINELSINKSSITASATAVADLSTPEPLYTIPYVDPALNESYIQRELKKGTINNKSSKSSTNNNNKSTVPTINNPRTSDSFIYPGPNVCTIYHWFTNNLRELIGSTHQWLLDLVLNRLIDRDIDIKLMLDSDPAELGCPILDEICTVFSEINQLFIQSNTSELIRNQFFSCCFIYITNQLFNTVLSNLKSISMIIAMKLQVICTSIEEYCIRISGPDCQLLVQIGLIKLKQLSLLLLIDKSKLTITDLIAADSLYNQLNLAQLIHILTSYNLQSQSTSSDKCDQSIITELIRLKEQKLDEINNTNTTIDTGESILLINSIQSILVDPKQSVLIDIDIDIPSSLVLSSVSIPTLLARDSNKYFQFLKRDDAIIL